MVTRKEDPIDASQPREDRPTRFARVTSNNPLIAENNPKIQSNIRASTDPTRELSIVNEARSSRGLTPLRRDELDFRRDPNQQTRQALIDRAVREAELAGLGQNQTLAPNEDITQAPDLLSLQGGLAVLGGNPVTINGREFATGLGPQVESGEVIAGTPPLIGPSSTALDLARGAPNLFGPAQSPIGQTTTGGQAALASRLATRFKNIFNRNAAGRTAQQTATNTVTNLISTPGGGFLAGLGLGNLLNFPSGVVSGVNTQLDKIGAGITDQVNAVSIDPDNANQAYLELQRIEDELNRAERRLALLGGVSITSRITGNYNAAQRDIRNRRQQINTARQRIQQLVVSPPTEEQLLIDAITGKNNLVNIADFTNTEEETILLAILTKLELGLPLTEEEQEFLRNAKDLNTS